MAILEILQYPDPRLRTKAVPITVFDDALKQVVADMYETMYKHKGLGLAGTQVNIHQQIFVMDLSEAHDQPICAINAEIISSSGKQIDYHGCLSVGANISDKIPRAALVKFRALDEQGKPFEMELDGVGAICVQHEMDHLNGKLFIDHVSKLKLSRIKKKIEKFRRDQEQE